MLVIAPVNQYLFVSSVKFKCNMTKYDYTNFTNELHELMKNTVFNSCNVPFVNPVAIGS